MRFSKSFLRPNLRQTFLFPDGTPSEIDPPTLVKSFWYSIMIDLSLYIWTLMAKSISQQFYCGFFISKTLNCQLLISKVVVAPQFAEASHLSGLSSFLRFRFDLQIFIYLKAYIAQSSKYLI